jgi:hypothetical protein
MKMFGINYNFQTFGTFGSKHLNFNFRARPLHSIQIGVFGTEKGRTIQNKQIASTFVSLQTC